MSRGRQTPKKQLFGVNRWTVGEHAPGSSPRVVDVVQCLNGVKVAIGLSFEEGKTFAREWNTTHPSEWVKLVTSN